MRRLKQFSMAVVFTLVLATAAFAGIIQTPAAPPAPQPATAGIIQTGSPAPSGHPNLDAPGDSYTDVTLTLLQSLLLMF